MPGKKIEKFADVLQKMTEDSEIKAAVSQTAKDIFFAAIQATDPTAKKLDKKVEEIEPSKDVQAVAEVFADAVLNMVLNKWKEIQGKKP